MRDILVHFHIFKNAGTTIEWILKKNFSKEFVRKDKDDPSGILTINDIRNILKEDENIKAISSHQIRFPLPKNENINFHPIIFIRHPIDRIFSIYSFQRRRTDTDRPGVRKAKELNLNDYIKWNYSLKKFMPMRNFQVLYLSDKSVKSTVDENDYKIALQRMKEIKMMGIVERFDESLLVAEEYLRKYFPNIDLSYKSQNISSERKGNLQERIKDDFKRLDKDTIDEIFEKNNYDLMLYEKAKDELNSRIQRIENFEKKLNDFKKRCKTI